MSTTTRRLLSACVLASTLFPLVGAPAMADTVTGVYHGSGYSDWGFAIHYARAQAGQRAAADGFAYEDCVETETVIRMFEAHVTWECTRET
ncbi:hypothetical protein [Kibdelosporangium phytohabitans]|uniref:DUF732 domain-containing protein n=1 Tax=Kibdelosporangium phytohabitans TaxID=860235 RepID=A0A0N9HYS8_9PSEU|nr:hypothetical protein [Kibdelosporangium phytohabitans]ALG08491.1 hypothetical protein AOZ06_17615 [Kibdelosporangium phytohabitans]MBE1470444.1 hypothetical protein [Kibdelosporangium phytohabitans]